MCACTYLQVGPYDHTPKRPSSNSPIGYWHTEEGIVARQEDPVLRDGVKITRHTLPPRPSQGPRGPASPGLPSQTVHGVYFTAQPTQGAAQGTIPETSAVAQGDLGTAEAETQGAFQPAPDAFPVHSPARRVPHASGKVDYSYPELAASSIRERKGAGQSLRSPAYDIYGQPRAVAPILPPVHRVERAEAGLNESHLQAEGSALRVPGGKTSSGQLLRASGKLVKQFELTPAHIHFGTVQQGQVVHRTARLKNTSTGHARFSVDRPTLPLKAIYKPGGIAAGMDALITVELCAAQAGDFVGEVVVRSELNVITLTVSAKVVGGPAGTGAEQGAGEVEVVEAQQADAELSGDQDMQ